MPLLEINNLSYRYPGEHELHFPDFSVKSGQNTLIFGQSGVGKTTLLHLIAGIRRIQQGKIKIEGRELSQMEGHRLDSFRAENLSIIFQDAIFISGLNVIDNIVLPSRFKKNNEAYKEKAYDLLKSLGLESKSDKGISTLSTGEKQRISIIRAFITHPKLIIADEPSSALDDENCHEVMDLMFRLSDDYNTTFLVVSHDHRLQEKFKNRIQLK